jgi:hypothetical protein
MDRLYHFVGKHIPEILALLASGIALVVGGVLAWQSNPAWLNRTGSIIIIIGVLLAASRFHEWMVQKVAESIEKNPELFFQKALAVIEKQKGAPIADEERTNVLANIKEQYPDKEEFTNYMTTLIEPDKKRLKLWEIYLVVGGTFLNGFGDYIISILKAYGT